MGAGPGGHGTSILFPPREARFHAAPGTERLQHLRRLRRIIACGAHVADAEVVGLEFLASRIAQRPDLRALGGNLGKVARSGDDADEQRTELAEQSAILPL